MTHCNGGRVRWGSGIGITAMLAAGLAAFGSTWTWTGGGTNDLWSEAANWLQGTKPTSSNTTRLVFDGTTRLTPEQDIARDFWFNSLVFSNNAGPFQLGGTTNIDGEAGWLSLRFADPMMYATNPSLTVLGTNDILIKGVLKAIPTGTNRVTVPAGVMLQVPWIRTDTECWVVKDGAGTLRVYEHEDGQRYAVLDSTVGPRYRINDGTVEFGTRTNRYVCPDSSYTNWALDPIVPKLSSVLIVGDGIGSETSAVARMIAPEGWPVDFHLIVHPDGLFDLNGMRDLSSSSSTVYSNNSGVIRFGSATWTITIGTRLWLRGDARIEGTAANTLKFYFATYVHVDSTETRAVLDCGTRFIGGVPCQVGPIFVVADKPADEVDLELVRVLGEGGTAGGPISVRKEGAGTMLIGGALVYGSLSSTGMVAEGTLLINTGGVVRSLDGRSPHLWHVYTNATLGGSGAISNAAVFVYSGGIAPGLTSANRSGILTLWSNLTFSANSQLRIDVTGGNQVPGVDHDQLLVKRDVAGLSNVDLYVTVHGSPDLNGDALTILDAQNSLAGQSFARVFYNGPGSMEVDTSSGDVVLKFRSAPQGTFLLLH